MKRCIQAFVLLAAAAVVSSAAALDTGWLYDKLHIAQQQNNVRLSPAQAAQRAQRQHGGKVLAVTLQREGDRAYYRVKLIEQGQVRVVRVPAN